MLEQAIERLTLEIEKLRHVLERADKIADMDRHSKPIVGTTPSLPSSREGFMTEREVADYAGMSLGSVRKWRQLRKGPPARKFGRSVRYSRAEVFEWLYNQTTK